MKKICGWCNKDLGDIEAPGLPEDAVTTGIYPLCANFFSRSDWPIADFLNSLAVPVLVLNEERRVEFANHRACHALGKNTDEFKGRLTGDVFQCAHARLPGGCGNTEHCKGCVLKKAVMKTFETEERQQEITARLKVVTPSGESESDFKISTAKRNGLVLLRIDK